MVAVLVREKHGVDPGERLADGGQQPLEFARTENPASTRTRAPSVTSRALLPELPLPRMQKRIAMDPLWQSALGPGVATVFARRRPFPVLPTAPRPADCAGSSRAPVSRPMANFRTTDVPPSRRPRAADRALAYLTRTPAWGRGRSVRSCAASCSLIGLVDWSRGRESPCGVFYDLPIALAVAWLGLAGGRDGLSRERGDLACGDYFDRGGLRAHGRRSPGMPASRWSMYLVFVWILSAFIALHRGSSDRVRERTSRWSRRSQARPACSESC